MTPDSALSDGNAQDTLGENDLEQRPPTFLAPGTGFVQDNFSTGGRGDGQALKRAMGSGR